MPDVPWEGDCVGMIDFRLVLIHSRGTHAHESPWRVLVLLPPHASVYAAREIPAIVAHVPLPEVMFVFPLVLHADDALQIGVGVAYVGEAGV